MPVKFSNLTKMQTRKLNALRKSLGNMIADKAFREWLDQQPSADASADPTKEEIRKRLEKPMLAGDLKIGREGFIIRRGRGRLLVEDVKKPAKNSSPKRKAAGRRRRSKKKSDVQKDA